MYFVLKFIFLLLLIANSICGGEKGLKKVVEIPWRIPKEIVLHTLSLIPYPFLKNWISLLVYSTSGLFKQERKKLLDEQYLKKIFDLKCLDWINDMIFRDTAHKLIYEKINKSVEKKLFSFEKSMICKEVFENIILSKFSHKINCSSNTRNYNKVLEKFFTATSKELSFNQYKKISLIIYTGKTQPEKTQQGSLIVVSYCFPKINLLDASLINFIINNSVDNKDKIIQILFEQHSFSDGDLMEISKANIGNIIVYDKNGDQPLTRLMESMKSRSVMDDELYKSINMLLNQIDTKNVGYTPAIHYYENSKHLECAIQGIMNNNWSQYKERKKIFDLIMQKSVYVNLHGAQKLIIKNWKNYYSQHNCELLQCILSHGLSPKKSENYRETILHNLIKCDENFDLSNHDKYTVIDLFLQYGANPNSPSERPKDTVAMFPNLLNKFCDQTPLSLALSKENKDLAELLSKYKVFSYRSTT